MDWTELFVMEDNMSNVTEFPTPRERAGVSMLEDMDNLLDCLMGAMMGLKHSENVTEEDRAEEIDLLVPLFVKYVTLRSERYPEAEGDLEE
jgi:hypothetical protein